MSRRKKLGIATVFIFAILATLVVGTNLGYNYGHEEGFLDALQTVRDHLGDKGIEFTWSDLGDGRYELHVQGETGIEARGTVEIHINVWQYRDGKLLDYSHHAGVLMNIGKDFIEQQVSGSASTTNAIYIACSDDATAPVNTWTVVGGSTTDELNANGFTRATGTYASTGTGTWNVTYTFSATGTQTVRLYGLNWSATSRSDNNLLCADTSSDKNCVNGDTLKVTWQCTVA